MTVFVDTSAFYAMMDGNDQDHAAAVAVWDGLVTTSTRLVTTNYALVETLALIQRRLGMPAARVYLNDIVPLLSVVWVDDSLHRAAISMLLAANRRDLGFVDCTSVELMRTAGMSQAFAFDGHFTDQGFDCLGPT